MWVKVRVCRCVCEWACGCGNNFFLLFILFLCTCVCDSVRPCRCGYFEMFDILGGHFGVFKHGDPAADRIVRGPLGGCPGDLISVPDSGYYRVFCKSFLVGNLSFGGCFEKPRLQALFWCKKLRSWSKIGKVTKRRRLVKSTCTNGGTNRTNGGTNARFSNFWRVAKSFFDFDRAKMKQKKKKTKENKHYGQRQREKISITFRRASSLEKDVNDCLHLVRRVSHAVDVAVHV